MNQTAVKTATIIGAGTVGLSTAWFLQEKGIEVTVVDKTGVASGSSWGNAGWLTPGTPPRAAGKKPWLRSLE